MYHQVLHNYAQMSEHNYAASLFLSDKSISCYQRHRRQDADTSSLERSPEILGHRVSQAVGNVFVQEMGATTLMRLTFTVTCSPSNIFWCIAEMFSSAT